MILVQGKGVSKGVVKGKLYFYQRPDTTITKTTVEDTAAELRRLAEAQQKSIYQLEQLADKCRAEAGDESAVLFETPASVFMAKDLAKLVDFFSVGTNDLTQYTLACDRQCNDLGKFYDPHHPAVLRALKMAADAAHKAGIWIGICGELGADISLLPTFMAIGIDELSVTPTAVLPLRQEIRNTDTRTCDLSALVI